MPVSVRSGPVDIRAVNSCAPDERRFMEFAWTLYADDPHWIPPPRDNQREMLNYKHSAFYIENRIQTFLALRGEQVVGRIAAIVNFGHNRRFKEERGFFGFFESIDDEAVAGAMFDAAKKWLREQGQTTLRGPVNPSLNHEVGLLVDAFDKSPFFMMTYNKPYYEKLLLSTGLTKTQDLFAYYGHVNMLAGLDKKLQYIIDASCDRFNVVIRPMSRKTFDQDLKAFVNIYNSSLVKTWGFVPFSEAEGKHLAVGLKQLLVPELVLFAEIDGKPVGFCAALLDYNPRIKKIDGKLFPFGFLRLLWNKRAIKNLHIISTNVIPEYQSWGIGLVLLNGLIPKVMEWGMQEAEFSWVLESNHLSRASVGKRGRKALENLPPVRRHALTAPAGMRRGIPAYVTSKHPRMSSVRRRVRTFSTPQMSESVGFRAISRRTLSQIDRHAL
ncbi:MAG: GNAT family N-acetyltransferase [Pirellulales bacterium]